MLVLTRKPGEQIQIGENVFITIVRIGGNSVKIGIDAPRDIEVLRTELKDGEPKPVPQAEAVR